MDAGLDAGVDGGGDAGPPDGGFDPTRPLVADCSHRWIETTDIDSDFTHVLAAADDGARHAERRSSRCDVVVSGDA